MILRNRVPHTLDKYVDQLYFGMLSMTPDSSITDFVTRYFPFVFEKSENGGEWTAYPPGTIEEPAFYTVTHSYRFDSHLHFKAKFTSGQLAISQNIYSNENWNRNISDVKVWFEFDNEADAKVSFEQLVNSFSNFNVRRRITKYQGMDKVEFTDKNSDKYYSRIQITLAIDYTLGKRYVTPDTGKVGIIYTDVGYRLHLDIGNETYLDDDI